MSANTQNAEINVSAAKGVTGGYVYRAPVGSTLPNSPDWEPDGTWTCMGYVTEDGETFSTESEVQEFRDQNGDIIDTSQSSYGESFSCSFAETKKAVFESMYGEDAVKDEGGVLEVNHTGAEPGTYSYAFLFLLKNGRKWVRCAEKCKRTELSDMQANSSTLVAWGATYRVIKSETTEGYFEDFFESTETGQTGQTGTTGA